MPRSERLLRLVERRLMPWFDREQADQAVADAEKLHESAATTRKEAKEVIAKVDATTKLRKGYTAAGNRLAR